MYRKYGVFCHGDVVCVLGTVMISGDDICRI